MDASEAADAAPAAATKGATTTAVQPAGLSLGDVQYTYDGPPTSLTPRSRLACQQEGIALQDLWHRDAKSFAEPNLEPRLIKLRYDFHEAKRTDNFALVKARRLQNIQMAGSHVDFLALPVHQTDAVKLERAKFNDAKKMTHQWLKTVLKKEENELQRLYSNFTTAKREEKAGQDNAREQARLQKERNERRRMEEEQKQKEAQAQQQLEKQRQQQEFALAALELQRKEELKRMEQKRQHQRHIEQQQLKEAHDRYLKELEEKRIEDQARKQRENDEADRRRRETMENQRKQLAKKNQKKQELLQHKMQLKAQNDAENERIRNEKAEATRLREQYREERLENEKMKKLQEGLMNGKKEMARRQMTKQQAFECEEARRQRILQKQADNQLKMEKHDMNRNAYLAFKKELQEMQELNKQMNVQRQRRKEESKRQDYAGQAQMKTLKSDSVLAERARLQRARQHASMEAGRARAAIKEQINRMRIKNSFSDHSTIAVKNRIQKILQREMFNPDPAFDAKNKRPQGNLQEKPLYASDKQDGAQIEAFFEKAQASVDQMGAAQ